MILDQTSKKRNFVYSMKKFIVSEVYTNLGILLIFDEFLPPDISETQWLFVDFGNLDRDCVSSFSLEIYCVTRRDYEGDALHELVDKVVGVFTDNTTTDGFKRIPFYDATTLVQNGSMIVTDYMEGKGGLEAPDKSKFTILTITARMASK